MRIDSIQEKSDGVGLAARLGLGMGSWQVGVSPAHRARARAVGGRGGGRPGAVSSFASAGTRPCCNCVSVEKAG